MNDSADDRELRERFERIESLLRKVEQHADPDVLASVQEIVQTLLDFHGAGLRRVLDRLAESAPANLAVRLAEDELVGSLLLLHGLHPLDLEARVQRALDSVRPSLHSHGGDVELVAIAEGAVRLHLHWNGQGCRSSTRTLRQSIEEAVLAGAPDVTALDIEGVVDEPARPVTTFIPIEELHTRLIQTTKETVP